MLGPLDQGPILHPGTPSGVHKPTHAAGHSDGAAQGAVRPDGDLDRTLREGCDGRG